MKNYAPLVALLLLAACQQPTTFGPKITPDELAREQSIQKQMVDEAAKYGGAERPWRKRSGINSQFARVADRIDKAGAKMCQDMGWPALNRRCYYYFRLALDRELNAHADGKNIVIYSGMMYFLKDDDEVAVILAHELAHNMMGHIDAGKQNVMAGMVAGALIDGIAASQGVNTRGGWSDTGAQAGLLSYSVEFEEEADYVGLYIAARAGYDIRKAPDVWRRMTIEDPDALFREMTHPANPKRAALLQKGIEEVAYKRKHRLPLIPEFKNDATY